MSVRAPKPDLPMWLDGRWLPGGRAGVALADPGLLAGLGVFETIAVHGRACLEKDAHLARLRHGAGRLGVPLPSPAALEDALERIAREVSGESGWLKVLATRGGTCAVFGAPMTPSEQRGEASAVLLRWRRSPRDPLAGCKTLNYAPFVLGLQQAERRGADEGLWLNTRGHLAEGCASNVFVIHQRRLFTPAPGDGILPGVTRALALEAAARLGLVVHQGRIRLRRLERAQEAFLSSSLQGIRPLTRFNRRKIGSGAPGPVTRAIADEVLRIRAERVAAASPVGGRR